MVTGQPIIPMNVVHMSTNKTSRMNGCRSTNKTYEYGFQVNNKKLAH